MLLFALLAIALCVLIAFTVTALGLAGGVFVILFADVIVCIGIIVLLMRHFRNKKNQD